MENYYKGHNGSRFGHSFEQKDNSDFNTLVLDLSRKKHVTSTLSEVGIIQPIGLSQTLSSAKEQKYQEIHFLDENTQTPIAGSSAMLSPYSESNSPKKMKTDSVDYHENSNQLKLTVPLTNTHNITPGVTMVTPQQPSLLAFPNEATNIPVVSKIYLPYIETPQSFITNNEIRKIVSMPTECSTSDMKLSTSSEKKTPRPFKAYPNNFLTVVNTVDHNSNENYAKFRQMILENVQKMNKNTSNPKMRRTPRSVSSPGLPTSTVDEKDAIYWERRKKNNEAAKRSRDARRAKEDELAIRTSFLEYENAQLRMEVQRLKMEAERHIYLQ
ncbi:Hepatic leukemia factor [Trachymyrmex cornetzi]|uniref:Hepatic leukemia factor n=2 Tax=Trachymyrmex cornetzi TaxID=471704 RepID=A0A195DLW1_9HYME|nr:Hepatic leukemia factor [Trachymyrmex cornetzi]